MPAKTLFTLGRLAPRVVGILPLLALASGGAFVSTVACSNGDNPSDQVTPPVDLGMTDKMVPYYQDQKLTMYEVQTPVALPVRAPDANDWKTLGPVPKGTPYPRAPFLKTGDELVTLHYTISNIDNQQHAVWLLVDPWNEFVRWDPGVTVVSDEETSPNWGYDLAFLMAPQSRVEGTLTSDDMQEIAIKLASVENMLASPQAKAATNMDAGSDGADDPNAMSSGPSSFDPAATANNIFNPQNRSNSGDPLYSPWIPPVVAGLTGFDLGLRTYEAANIAIEITMEIQDVNGNRFIAQGTKGVALLPMPTTTLRPPGAKL